MLNPQLARINLDRRGIVIADNVTRTRRQIKQKIKWNASIPSRILNAPIPYQIPMPAQMNGLVTMMIKTLNSGVLHFLSLPFVIYYTTEWRKGQVNIILK
jgi:hypothetical protein